MIRILIRYSVLVFYLMQSDMMWLSTCCFIFCPAMLYCSITLSFSVLSVHVLSLFCTILLSCSYLFLWLFTLWCVVVLLESCDTARRWWSSSSCVGVFDHAYMYRMWYLIESSDWVMRVEWIRKIFLKIWKFELIYYVFVYFR